MPILGMACDAYTTGREELAELLDKAAELADEMNLWVGGSPAQKAFQQIAAQLRELIAKENS
jgi:hypothetical protein